MQFCRTLKYDIHIKFQRLNSNRLPQFCSSRIGIESDAEMCTRFVSGCRSGGGGGLGSFFRGRASTLLGIKINGHD